VPDRLKNKILVGDVLECLQEIPGKSVQCCVAKPPVYEGGSVPEYVKNLLLVFGSVHRALKHNGSLWLHLEDAYEDKELLGVPWRTVFALKERAWRLRTAAVWGPSAHEYLFLLSPNARAYYDKSPALEAAKTTPEDLAAQCIKTTTKKGDLVLDLFAGSGTVLSVAFQHGRDFIGIEADPERATEAQAKVGSAAGLRSHKDTFDAFGL